MGMCLAVDASGYIISLIIQMMGKDKELRLDIPSDYHKIEEKIEEDLLDIELAFGCNFTFFFDGKKTKFPKKREERDRRIRDSWGELWAAVHSSKASKEYAANLADRRHKADYVFPALMMEALRTAIKRLQMLRPKWEVIECDYEADHHIAQYCAEKNKGLEVGKERVVILGGDSDFMVMRDCTYLWINREHRSDSGYLPDLLEGKCDGKLWRRKDTAASLGLSEENFREFAIVMGNDYTNMYKWSDFDEPYRMST